MAPASPANDEARAPPADGDGPDFDEVDDYAGNDGQAAVDEDALAKADAAADDGAAADAAADAAAGADVELVEPPDEKPSRNLYFIRFPRPVVDDMAAKRARVDFDTALAKLNKLNAKLGIKRTAVQELRKQKAIGRFLKVGSREGYRQKLGQLREMGDVRKTNSKNLQDIKSNLSVLDVKSEEELDAHVKELEARIAHENIPLREEKDTVKQIAKLRAQRPRVREFGAHSENLADLQNENTKVRASVADVESDFHILKFERKQAQKIIVEIQGKLLVAEKELKEAEEEQADLVKAKNDAAEAITAARWGSDAASADWSDNRKLSAKIRDMVEGGQVEEARELCEQQVEVWAVKLASDAAFRKEYTTLWAGQRRQAVSELLPQSATSPKAVAARAAAAHATGAPAAGGKGKGPIGPVVSAKDRAAALIASCMSKSKVEVAAMAQRHAARLRMGGVSGAKGSDGEETYFKPEVTAPAKKGSEPFRPAAAAAPAATAPAGPKVAPVPMRIDKFSAAAAAAVEMPKHIEDVPFVAPAAKGNLSGLDARVKELEARIAHEDSTMREEKEIVKQVAKLGAQRPRVRRFGAPSENLADLQNENTKVRASIADVESEFHILRSEREQVQKIIVEIQGKLAVAEKELKEAEEEQADLVKAKNDAAEAITAARSGNDAASADWRDNRKLSAQIRDMVEGGQVEEARALCEQQVEVWAVKRASDAAFRKEYTTLWASQHCHAVSELLTQSATSPEAVAARAAAARAAAPAAGGKGKGPTGPVVSAKDRAAALIASCMSESKIEVAAMAQRRAAGLPMGGAGGAQGGSSSDGEERDFEPEVAAAPAKKGSEPFRPAAAAAPAATVPAGPKVAPVPMSMGKFSAAAAASVEMPKHVEDVPFVAPAAKVEAAAVAGLSEAELKEKVREEQRYKAAEAEERKRKKAEGAERKRLQAIDAKKRAEDAARAAKAAALAPPPVGGDEDDGAAAAAPPPPPAATRTKSGSTARANTANILATQKVVSAKRPKDAGKAPLAKWSQKVAAPLLDLGEKNAQMLMIGFVAFIVILILAVIIRIVRA